MGGILAKYHLCLWTLLSHRFVLKWLMGTKNFEQDCCSRQPGKNGLQSNCPGYLVWMSTKSAYFCQWRARILIIIIWLWKVSLQKGTFLLKSKIIFLNQKQPFCCSLQSHQAPFTETVILSYKTRVVQTRQKQINSHQNFFWLPKITTSSCLVETK